MIASSTKTYSDACSSGVLPRISPRKEEERQKDEDERPWSSAEIDHTYITHIIDDTIVILKKNERKCNGKRDACGSYMHKGPVDKGREPRRPIDVLLSKRRKGLVTELIL